MVCVREVEVVMEGGEEEEEDAAEEEALVMDPLQILPIPISKWFSSLVYFAVGEKEIRFLRKTGRLVFFLIEKLLLVPDFLGHSWAVKQQKQRKGSVG